MRGEYVICFIFCMGMSVTGFPVGTTHVQVYTEPVIEKIIVHVQRRMAEIWDFWQLNSSKFIYYN